MNGELHSIREQNQKQKRMNAVLELVGRFSISTQGELVEKLREVYQIETNQSAVSRDVKGLKLIKDEQGCYTLSREAKSDRAIEKLRDLFLQMQAVQVVGAVSGTLFRLPLQSVHMAPMIAHTLESIFPDGDVAAFVNGSGAILVAMPEEKRGEVERMLHDLLSN